MEEKSDTPRTDAAAQFVSHFGWQVHADFARDLERELATATRERDEARARVSDLVENGERLKAVADSVVRDAADIAEAKCALLRDRIEHQVAQAQNERDEARAEVERMRSALQEILEDSSDEGARECAREALAATEAKP